MAQYRSGQDEVLSTQGQPNSGWDQDPFYDPGLDDAGDAELDAMVKAAETSSSHQTTALSALSAQMGVYRPLTPAEQTERLKLYNDGLSAAAKLATETNLSTAQQEALQASVRRGDAAQTELVGSMFRLVLIIAREQSARRFGRERAMDQLADLVADANVSVVDAIHRYDPSRGPAFNVYASRVVRDRVREAVSHSGLEKIPSPWLRVRRLSQTLSPELALKLGRQPTVAEMQEGLMSQAMAWALDHLTPEQLALPEKTRNELAMAKLVKQGMCRAIRQYEEVMVVTQSMWNLDAPIGTDGTARLIDTVVAETSDETFDAVELTQLRETLMESLSTLPDRDREIVLYRFGFIDGDQWTYAKLAPRYSISAERVRQIERAALGKLRGPEFNAIAAFLP